MAVEIGAMLREARMRAQLDVADVEARTKIRAKYLRALESEEWHLVPGPTYVKSFLRTYADMLALDSKLLVEEFKLRHERPSEIDLQPIRSNTSAGRSARRPPGPPRIPPWGIAAGVVALLVVILAVLGSGGGGGNTPTPTPSSHVVPLTPPVTLPRRTVPIPTRVEVRITPTAPVYVCLIGDGRKVINGQILAPGVRAAAGHRAKRFLLTLGNGSVKLRAGGKNIAVPQSSNGIGYEITPKGHKVLALGKRPTCA
ncbi:MAG: helix-turn-helix domain-containing protein [Solirubrobacteraceae bacterium]